ncbi:hypothetical protein B296_00057658 [Ensete ventricosum]|uniref:Uncharacterized protein n=1 Tax=Ensete ventricosum TaxID=4639 RepID=A0A426X1L5_ENSVE|nr:hypothetical protein B296_00057658 [Ensete ventricosum]
MLRLGVTQEWVDEGELPRERTKNWRWRRPYDVLAEATYGEVIASTSESHGGDLIIQRYDRSDRRVGLLQWSHSLKGARQVRGRSRVKLLGGHNSVEASGRKGRGSDDESSGAQLPRSKVSVRKEVDSEEHHSVAKVDLLIAKEGMQMQDNG